MPPAIALKAIYGENRQSNPKGHFLAGAPTPAMQTKVKFARGIFSEQVIDVPKHEWVHIHIMLFRDMQMRI